MTACHETKPGAAAGFPSRPGTGLLLTVQDHLPVSSFAIGEMQEAFPLIHDGLVKRQPAFEQNLQQVLRTGSAITIGCFVSRMLARGNTAHQTIHFLITKTAGNGNGFT